MTNETETRKSLPFYELHAKLRVRVAEAEQEWRSSMTRKADPTTIAQNFGAWMALADFRDHIFLTWPID